MPRHPSVRSFVALSLAPLLAGLLSGCAPPIDDTADTSDADTSSGAFTARATLEQIYVTHAKPGTALTVQDQYGRTVHGMADPNGSKVFRNLTPGNGYSVVEDSTAKQSGRLFVRSAANHLPSPDLYTKQALKRGFNYITMRDGTTLSAYVTLPGADENAEYPTVVAYSGYNPSEPGGAPKDTSAMIAAAFGFATVSVNMRGTGCSGGAYDYFEPLQLTDGYDVIETVAQQKWAKHHKVGMVGLSYPGISQLFVASTRPPHLAAIAPMSVIGNTYTTLRPGGMMNNGFAINWVNNVVKKAAPYGQGWEKKLVDAGDEICRENQLLHSQKIDNVGQAQGMEFYDPAQSDRYNPEKLVGNITVPVFMGGSMQDEQTGPFFTTLLDKMGAAPSKHFVLYNGVHIDGFAPQVLVEWLAFLDIFVAKEAPTERAAANQTLPLALKAGLFMTEVPMPRSEWTQCTTHAEALALWNATPSIRVILENGGVAGRAGAPVGTFEQRFDAWPPREQIAERYFFSPDGVLAASAPTAEGAASSFGLDAQAGLRGVLPAKPTVWLPLPAYAWPSAAPGSAVVMESAALDHDVVMLGNGSADLWVRGPVDDADLEVNLTEVRPDGQEMYVQSGWMRASLGKLAPGSTELAPVPTYAEADRSPMIPGRWTAVRVPIAAFSHVFRAGSKIRVSVDTPGDSRVAWTFDLKTFPDPVRYDIGHGKYQASSVVLPVIPNVTAPSALPACPSQRGKPCRAYQAYANTPVPSSR